MQQSFDSNMAKEYGLIESIIINHFVSIFNYNTANDFNIENGRAWVYYSAIALKKQIPYVSRRTISRALLSLCDNNVLISKEKNVSDFDRTLSYTFTDSFMKKHKDMFINEEDLIVPSIEDDIEDFEDLEDEPTETNNTNVYVQTNLFGEEEPIIKANEEQKVAEDTTDYEGIFEEFRKSYSGKKRGHDVEFNLLKKKHPKTWKEDVKIMLKAVKVENEQRAKANIKNEFYSQPQNLSTYINNRSWEQYVQEEDIEEENETQNKQYLQTKKVIWQ